MLADDVMYNVQLGWINKMFDHHLLFLSKTGYNSSVSDFACTFYFPFKRVSHYCVSKEVGIFPQPTNLISPKKRKEENPNLSPPTT